MKFCTLTLGCKVNQFETQALESILISRGHSQAKPGDGCDACIINTCAVTSESARKSRQAVRRMKNLEPGAIIAVCGCLSQLDAEAVVSLGADLAGGSGDRQGFALKIEKVFEQKRINPVSGELPLSVIAIDKPAERDVFEELWPGVCYPLNMTGNNEEQNTARDDKERRGTGADSREDKPGQGLTGRTRALLKIQDGCNNFCSYCIVPYARGRARSLPVGRAAEHARRLAGQGFREIVITGIEISSYGRDLAGNPTLTDAIREISAAAPGARLRLGSLDPAAVTENLCAELNEVPGICRHFHLSLQSGCDETLGRMERRYGAKEAWDAISRIRSRFQDCGITADLITGFPGETEVEFDKTMTFIRDAAFSGMHIFPFSPRPGTAAAALPGQVMKNVRQERARIAAAAAEEMALGFRQRLTGKTVEVLFEREREGFWIGHSDNYVEVAVMNGGAKNDVRNVLIKDARDGIVLGEIVH